MVEFREDHHHIASCATFWRCNYIEFNQQLPAINNARVLSATYSASFYMYVVHFLLFHFTSLDFSWFLSSSHLVSHCWLRFRFGSLESSTIIWPHSNTHQPSVPFSREDHSSSSKTRLQNSYWRKWTYSQRWVLFIFCY